MITGAFLAESASVVDNKLTVSGGVLSRYVVGPERAANFVLVVLTQTETDNPVRLVSVEIHPPTGDEPHVLECALPQSAAVGAPADAVTGTNDAAASVPAAVPAVEAPPAAGAGADDDDDAELHAMMGFGGFGGSKKR